MSEELESQRQGVAVENRRGYLFQEECVGSLSFLVVHVNSRGSEMYKEYIVSWTTPL